MGLCTIRIQWYFEVFEENKVVNKCVHTFQFNNLMAFSGKLAMDR